MRYLILSRHRESPDREWSEPVVRYEMDDEEVRDAVLERLNEQAEQLGTHTIMRFFAEDRPCRPT